MPRVVYSFTGTSTKESDPAVICDEYSVIAWKLRFSVQRWPRTNAPHRNPTEEQMKKNLEIRILEAFRSGISEMRAGIDRLQSAKLRRPTLALIYTTIDILASLTATPGEKVLRICTLGRVIYAAISTFAV